LALPARGRSRCPLDAFHSPPPIALCCAAPLRPSRAARRRDGCRGGDCVNVCVCIVCGARGQCGRRGHAGRPLNQLSAGNAVAAIGRISSLLYSTSTSMPGTVRSIETSTTSCTNCVSTFSMSRRECSVRVQDVHLDPPWLHQSPLHWPSSSRKQLQSSSPIVINVKARAGAC
jgi:hypothetical protein